MSNAIEVKNLTKMYGELTAVDGVSFSVKEGEVFGLLGENGAGKTTTLEMIEGLRPRSSGEIQVLGHEIQTAAGRRLLKNAVGIQLQSSAYFQYLTLREILDLFGSFYESERSADELLALVNLEEKANQFVGKLSGGQQQRFSIAASLVNNPKVIFLDEPTTGLDPNARRSLWEVIAQIKSEGRTIILTTHYMEEAERLCDRIAVMDAGKLVALDTTEGLIAKAGHGLRISFSTAKLSAAARKKLESVGTVREVPEKKNAYELVLKDRKHLSSAISSIQALEPELFTVREPTLDDAFIELTGKQIEEQ